jgi:hypothetical protein
MTKISPVIDRLFRFVEMVAVTALLSVLVRPLGLNTEALTLGIGVMLAMVYLTEPVIVWLVRQLATDDDRRIRALTGLIIILSCLFPLLMAIPVVSFVSFLIGLTLGS